MKKNIFAIAAAALVLCMASCQKEDLVNNGVANNGEENTTVRVKSTSDLHNTNWSYSITYFDFIYNLTGADLSCMEGIENDTMTFGLNFDGTYAHFSFPSNVEAWGGDENGMQQIFGVSYTYSYDATTHTGYLDGVAEDSDGNEVPSQLQFTYNDATDEITFNLQMMYADSGDPVTLTLVFSRDE